MKKEEEQRLKQIAELENKNQSLEVKEQNHENKTDEFLESKLNAALQAKDDTITDLTSQIENQDEIRKELEKVQTQLNYFRDGSLMDKERYITEVKGLEEKFEKEVEWFTSQVQQLELQLQYEVNEKKRINHQ